MPDDVRGGAAAPRRRDFLTQFIHSGLFVGVFRYLAPLCEEQLGVPRGRVLGDWYASEILRHQARFPELKERFEIFDLLTRRSSGSA